MDNFISLLPPNASRTERALAQANAAIGKLPTPARDLWNADKCPTALLPWLAWSFGVEPWNEQWSDAQRRTTIKSALFVQRHKGTIGAVRSALAALGMGAQIQEWFNQIPAGSPYTFRLLLDVAQVGIDQTALKRILDVVTSAKNLRSHLDTTVMGVTSSAMTTIAVSAGTGNDITVQFGGRILRMDGSSTMTGQYRMNGLKVPV